jgi:hypothetical protein
MADVHGDSIELLGLGMLKLVSSEPQRTSKLRFHTAEVAGSNPASPTLKSPVLQDFYMTEDRNLHRCSVRVQQRSDVPTSGVRNANEPRIGLFFVSPLSAYLPKAQFKVTGTKGGKPPRQRT